MRLSGTPTATPIITLFLLDEPSLKLAGLEILDIIRLGRLTVLALVTDAEAVDDLLVMNDEVDEDKELFAVKNPSTPHAPSVL